MSKAAQSSETQQAEVQNGGTGLFMLRLLAVLFTAVCQPVLSAPFNWWPLHWFSWVPFLWAINAQGGRKRVLLGMIAGVTSNYLIFYWIVNLLPNFSKIPMYVSIFLNLLICLGLSVLWMLLAHYIPKLQKHFPKNWVYLAPALLVTIEFFLPQMFPYMQGVSHFQVLPVVQLASLTGIYGVSFMVFWSNCVLYRGWVEKKNGRPWPVQQTVVLLLAVVLMLVYGYGRIFKYRQLEAKAKTLKIAMIQSNLQPKDHRNIRQIHKLYLKMSQEAVKQGADWIVWSEGEFKIPYSSFSARVVLGRMVRDIKKPLLIGGIDYRRTSGKFRVYNSAYLVKPGPTFSEAYDKIILVPFGEYMPFDKELDFIYKHVGWRSRYSSGGKRHVFTLDGVPFSYLICYEAIYPGFVRQTMKSGARLLVNVTYDACFGKTTAPYQHLMLAATRSAELGIPLIRMATSGVSTTVNALGKMEKLSPIFKREIVMRPLKLVYMPSIYSQIGDLFAWLCLIFVLFAAFELRLRPHPTTA